MPVPVLTFDSLIAELKTYQERGDATDDNEFFDQIPNFIISAERRIAIDLKIQGIISVISADLARGTTAIAKPDAWRQTVSMNAKIPTKVCTAVTRSSNGFLRTIQVLRAHGLVAGQTIVVSNVGSDYDGSYSIVSVTQKNVVYTGTTSVTEASTAVTDGYVTNAAFNMRPLFPRSYEYCRNYWPDDTRYDYPKYYADYNASNWLIVAPPKHTIGIEIHSYSHPEFLEASNQENWITQNLPDLLRYFVIQESAVFLKNTERAGVYMAKYMELLKSLDAEEVAKLVDRTSHRRRA